MGTQSTAVAGQAPPARRGSAGKRLLIFVVSCDLLLGTGVVLTKLPAAAPSGPTVAISLAVGSEDLGLLDNRQVQADFQAHGYAVTATGFGSYTIATQVDLSKYTLALPSSEVFTDALRAKVGAQQPSAPLFTTPLVVLTWQPLLPLLQTLKLATPNADGTWTFHIQRYVELADKNTLWSSIPGNTFYQNPNQVQLRMTDPAESNSGAMFVAAAGYALNNGSVVSTPAQVASVAAQLVPLFQNEGEMYDTTDHLFSDYETEGESGAPLVLSYESEFVGAKLTDPAGLPPGAVMMYTDPAIDSDHTILSLDDSVGPAFLSFIAGDKTFQQIAENDYGFRSGPDFVHDMSQRGITVAANLFPSPTPQLADLKELIDDATGTPDTEGPTNQGTTGMP